MISKAGRGFLIINLHPILAHEYPGMQHPPPDCDEQPCCPSEQAIVPVHDSPSGQHPTGPNPVSMICTHVVPVWQQLLGNPIAAQFEVPAGHEKSRFRSSGVSSMSHLGLLPHMRSETTANGARKLSAAEVLAARRASSSGERITGRGSEVPPLPTLATALESEKA